VLIIVKATVSWLRVHDKRPQRMGLRILGGVPLLHQLPAKSDLSFQG
jgi:hypothetical protein